uniref:(northern house mosquito) hypothetical protein n=1 Tax=Culex pipiens TaxID=7175 RepID=A0A8D8KN48_CULPI
MRHLRHHRRRRRKKGKHCRPLSSLPLSRSTLSLRSAVLSTPERRLLCLSPPTHTLTKQLMVNDPGDLLELTHWGSINLQNILPPLRRDIFILSLDLMRNFSAAVDAIGTFSPTSFNSSSISSSVKIVQILQAWSNIIRSIHNTTHTALTLPPWPAAAASNYFTLLLTRLYLL